MCGINGIASNSPLGPGLISFVELMNNQLEHRGPDSSGVWTSPKQNVAFGHQRLAINDLSPSGFQPMVSSTRRYAVSFNGEIYNHHQLRSRFFPSTYPWHGSSDTETLLALIELLGIENSLEHFVGMWAFALFDTYTHTLFLVNDRLGEKPLYWTTLPLDDDITIFFSSDLSALETVPLIQRTICDISFLEYFRLGHYPAPLTPYKEIRKLTPSSLIRIDLTPSTNPQLEISESTWWQPYLARNTDPRIPCEQLDSELESQLFTTISDQLHCDVNAATFLSGGIDSSLITAIAQKTSAQSITTLTVDFSESSYSEGSIAQGIADYLGTNHHSILVQPTHVLDVIPKIPSIYSEPFADSSQLPTTLICSFAKHLNLSVVLTGDGGDELFAGYNRHTWAPLAYSVHRNIPLPLRYLFLRILPSLLLNRNLLPILEHLPFRQVSVKLSKLASLPYHNLTPLDLYRYLLEYSSPLTPSLHPRLRPLAPTNSLRLFSSDQTLDISLTFQLLDILNYLPNDILVKLDRASMSASLEARCPFLDHRIQAISAHYPTSAKISSRVGKQPLRHILSKHLPSNLFDQPKSGFSIPLSLWLRTELKEWAHSLLSPIIKGHSPYFSSVGVRLLWQQHQAATHDHSFKLWTILMWQQWYQSRFNQLSC